MTDAIYKDGQGRMSAIKDPQSTLDFSFDWSLWLAEASDTISSYVFTESGGVTLSNQTNESGIVTSFVAGGTVGTPASLACRITTAGGRVDERTLQLVIKER
ncbi:MAG: hypothetical protein V4493_02840 [Pseudomonadota bacterium]